jgi:serine/threonine-protein kinase
MAEVGQAILSPVKSAESAPSIAVLPFANMSASKDDEYFSDGLAEEILNLLAHIPELKVTARTSSFAFRGKEQDITGIANALKVRAILEGSVRRAGNRIRVTAQLINAADGYHLWSERYDRELTDVFAVQDEIAAAIAKALHLKLAPKSETSPRYQPKPAAHEAFLRGRHLLLRVPEGHARGKEYLEQAIALDPQYSEPQAELGMYYLILNINGVRPMNEVAPLARAAAAQALELNPDEPRAHIVLGLMAALDCDWKTADEHIRRARDASELAPEVRVRAAVAVDVPRGRFAEAIREAEIALEQDPFNPLVPALLAIIYFLADQSDRAHVLAKQALELAENFWMPRCVLGLTYASRGMWAEAREWAESALRLSPRHPLCLGLLAAVLARSGENQQAALLLGDLDTAQPGAMVLYHLLCSESDAAADWLDKGIAQKDVLTSVWASPELFKPLRESPRWPALARKMNLP